MRQPIDFLPVAIYGGAGLVAVLILVFRTVYAKKRARAALAFARQEGFAVMPGAHQEPMGLFNLTATADNWAVPGGEGIVTARDLVRQLSGCIPETSGYDAANILVKQDDIADWCVFDYTTIRRDSRGNREYGRYGIVIARVPLMFHRVELKPENVFFKIGRALGMQEIDFEVEQFNKMYFVTAADRKFAFDLLCPKAIDTLMKFSPRHWQFDGPFVVILRSSFYDYYDALRAMEEIREVLQTVQPYLRQECGFSPTWQPLLGGRLA